MNEGMKKRRPQGPVNISGRRPSFPIMKGARFMTLLLLLPVSSCGGRVTQTREPGAAVSTGQGSGPEVSSIRPAAADNADGDGDTIRDIDDSCPADPEDKDNFEDADGCPDPDNDKDGIADGQDKCPNEAEVYNGKDDEDGCPDDLKVVIICQPPGPERKLIHYDKKSMKIKKEDIAILDEVAQVLLSHPEILRVEVAAHSDSKGSKKKNLELTKKMAQKTVDYLVGKGVDRKILSAAGYGGGCPLGPKLKEYNNRIEFFLLETAAGCTMVGLGCQESVPVDLVPEEDRKYLPGSDYCKNAGQPPSP
jgi:outer membrane protein OmpA-like peptidoglycan-associated protein